MSTGIVYVLVLLGYNSRTSGVSSAEEINWHLSHSDCLTAMSNERQWRTEKLNDNYACLRVQDYAMRAALEAGEAKNNFPRQHNNGQLILRW